MTDEVELDEKRDVATADNKGSNFAIDPDTLDAFATHQVDNFKAALKTRADEIIEGAEKWAEIKDLTDETERAANDFLEVVKAYEATVTAEHKRLKGPYLKAGSAFDEAKREMLPKAEKPKSIITELINGLLDKRRAEKVRVERELQEKADKAAREAEEKRAAAEASGPTGVAADVAAEEAEAAAAAAQKTVQKVSRAPVQSSGSTGRARSQRVSHVCEVTDWMKAFRCVKDDASVREAVERALRQRFNANRALVAKGHSEQHYLQGVKFTETRSL